MKNNFLKFGFICLVLSIVAQAAPYWIKAPIELSIGEGMEYTFDLKQYVESKKEIPYTFQKISGPTFLSISPNGVLAGTPSRENVGENRFQIAVSDREAGSIVTVILTVLKKPEVQAASLTCESGEKALFLGRTNSGDSIYSCAKN